MNSTSAKSNDPYEPALERASGVPRPSWFTESSNAMWSVVVGGAVLLLLGCVFWLALKP